MAVIYVNFGGGTDLSYENAVLGMSQGGITVSSVFSAEEQTEIINALNAAAAEGVTYVSEAPASGEYSTVYIGNVSGFAESYGTFDAIFEDSATGKAFVSADTVADAVTLISGVAGFQTGTFPHGTSSISNYEVTLVTEQATGKAGDTYTPGYGTNAVFTYTDENGGHTYSGNGAAFATIANSAASFVSPAGGSYVFADNAATGEGGAVYAIDKSDITFENVIFTGNTAASLGGAVSGRGKLIITDSQFLNNKSGDSGGAVLVDVASSSISGSTFSSNSAVGVGGAVFANKAMTITGSDFDNNSSKATGGAIHAKQNLTVTGGTFSGNEALTSGGAIHAEKELTIDKAADFDSNIAKTKGGAVYAASALTVTGGTFSGNEVKADNPATGDGVAGGAIYAAAGITINGTEFTDNKAGHTAGALYAAGSVDITNAKFSNNVADGYLHQGDPGADGGALYLMNGSGTISGSEFTGNTASAGGGAMMTNGNGSLTISDTVFTGNTASGEGGAIRNNMSLTLSNVTFENNLSTSGKGGAVNNLSDKTLTLAGLVTLVKTSDTIVNNGTLVIDAKTITDTMAEVVVVKEANSGWLTNKGSVKIIGTDGQETNLNWNGTYGGYYIAQDNYGLAVGRVDSGAFNLAGLVITSGGHTVSEIAGKELDTPYFGTVYSTLSEAVNNTAVSTVVAQDAGDLARVNAGSKALILDNVSFTGQTASHGGGAVNTNGSIEGYSVSFTSNEASGERSEGGAVFIDTSGSGIFDQAVFSGNTAASLGGAVSGRGKLTITDSQFLNNKSGDSGGAVLVDGASSSISGSTFSSNSAVKVGGAVFANKAMTITGSDFDNSSSKVTGGAIHANLNLTVTGGIFSGNEAKADDATDTSNVAGGAIYAAAGITINDTEFTGNKAGHMAGALYAKGSVDITNAKFSNNVADGYLHLGKPGADGGALYLTGSGTISKSEFTGNTASAGGGAMMTNGNGSLTVSGSKFANNTAASTGGAINNNISLTLDDVTFDGNTASSHGGAVYSASVLTVTGGTFSANTAVAGEGGAVYIAAKKTGSLENVEFTGNISTLGGAVSGRGTLTVTGSDFVRNESTGDGGAILIDAAESSISGSSFSNNKAAGHSGAVFVNKSATISGSTFTGNTAKTGGAVRNTSTLTLSNVTFDRNISTEGQGGAVYNNNTGTLTLAGYVVLASASDTIYNSGTFVVDAQSITDTVTEVVTVKEANADWFSGGGNVKLIGDSGESVSVSSFNSTVDGYYIIKDDYGLAVAKEGAYTKAAIVSDTATHIIDTVNGIAVTPPYAGNYFTSLGDALSGGVGTIVGQDIANADRLALGASVNRTIILDHVGFSDIADGAISMQKDTGYLTVYNSDFTNNGSFDVEKGGAVNINSDYNNTTALYNTDFSGNSAVHGGAVFSALGITVEKADFTGNKAKETGGAIKANNIAISGSAFTENIASGHEHESKSAGDGGAVYITSGNNNTVSNTVFTANTASSAGGAVFLVNGTVSISNSEFVSNKIAISEGSPMPFNNKGGAIFVNEGTLNLDNVEFRGNDVYTGGSGGAIYINSGSANLSNITLATASDTIYHRAGTLTFKGANTINASVTGNGTFALDSESNVSFTFGNTEAITVDGVLAGADALTFNGQTVNFSEVSEITGNVTINVADQKTYTIATNVTDNGDKQIYTVNGNSVDWDNGGITADGYRLLYNGTDLILTTEEATDAASFNAMAKSDAVTDIILTGANDFITSLVANGKELTITGEVKSQEARNGYNFYGGGVNSDKSAAGNVTIESGASVNFYAVCGGGYYNQGNATITGSSSITVSGDVTTTRLLGGGQISYKATTDSGASSMVTVKGNTSIVINGGNISRGEDYSTVGNAAVVCGGWQSTSGADVTIRGDSSVAIKGGTINAFVCGGGFLMNKTATMTHSGSASVTVTGGTINGHIIGGIMANTKDTIEVSGDAINSKIVVDSGKTATSVTINTTANAVTIGDDYNIYAGSFGKGLVSGDTCVTFTGDGSKLTFTGKVSGGATSAFKDNTETKTNNDGVAGDKHLVFDSFDGNFDASEIVFMDTVTFTNSEVKFTNTAINLADVTTWNFNLSGDGQGQDFTDNTNTFFNSGDIININWSGDNELLTNGVTVFTGNVTGWNSGVTIKYTGTADNVKLYVSDNNTLKLGIVATA